MKEGGALVAISSIAGGVYGWQEHSHYAAAKAGVPGLVPVARRWNWPPLGIRCNAVIPGLIQTPQSSDAKNSWGQKVWRKPRERFRWRVGRADEVASLAGAP